MILFCGGLALRGYLGWENLADGSVSPRAFQRLIYYPTWGRLDPLVFGVTLAAVESFRPNWWRYLTNSAIWLWLPGAAALIYGLYLGEGKVTIALSLWQFPLIAFGMVTLLLCALSPRLPFSRWHLPGSAFFASIAYSVYLSHKLVIHQMLGLCSSYQIDPASLKGHLLVQVAIYLTGLILFLVVERPFLQLRRRLVP